MKGAGERTGLRLQLNGKPHEAPEGSTLETLLRELDLRAERIAVAVNGVVRPRGNHPQVRLRDGDEVEIIHAVAGG